MLLSSYRKDFNFFSTAMTTPFFALIPTDGAPAATAWRAYSIWTNFPEGLDEYISQLYNLNKAIILPEGS